MKKRKVLKYVQENRQEGTTVSLDRGLFDVLPNSTSLLKRALTFIAQFAATTGLSERRRDARVSARELDANYASGSGDTRVKIKDISSTGAYLLTNHRWLVGTTLVLTLQSRSRRHRDSLPQVHLTAKVVRLGQDGLGVSFLHENVDAAHWLFCVSKAASLAPEGGAVRVFQMAKALSFLLLRSPSAEAQLLKLLGDELSDDRIERALEIVLRAEGLAACRNSGLKSDILPSLLMQILMDGSESNEEPMQQCWAALLAASSLDGSNDDEKLSFAALLSKLESVHVLTLAAAGQKATQAGFQPETIISHILYCKMDEIKRITRTKNVAVIECALNRLYEFGLLELTIRPFGCASLDDANVTPTKLGLAFYQACFGQQKLPEARDARRMQVAS